MMALIRGSRASFQLAGSEACHCCQWWQETAVPIITLLKAAKVVGPLDQDLRPDVLAHQPKGNERSLISRAQSVLSIPKGKV